MFRQKKMTYNKTTFNVIIFICQNTRTFLKIHFFYCFKSKERVVFGIGKIRTYIIKSIFKVRNINIYYTIKTFYYINIIISIAIINNLWKISSFMKFSNNDFH